MKPRKSAKKSKAAKGKKPAAAVEPKAPKVTESAKPSEVRHLTPAKTLADLLRTCRGLAANIGSINGELREKIGYAKEHKHLNTSAFGLIRRLDKMEPEKLAGFWDDVLAYMDAVGLTERIESVGKLPLEASKDEGDEAGETTRAPRAAKSGNGKAKPTAPAAPKAGIEPAGEVSRPLFGQPAAPAAPGGTVHMLPQVAGSKH